MRELSLFTGAGGGLLGTHLLGLEAVGYVEFNEYCQRLIRQRIEDGILNDAPIFGDIRAFIDEGYADSYQGMVDVVTGGFPCPPFSVAGKQLAGADPRNMWPQTIDVIRRVRPRYVFLENVSGLLAGSHGYFGHILGELAEAGYDAEWLCLSCADVGGPHKRDRLWIMAHTRHQPRRGEPIGTARGVDQTERTSGASEAAGSGALGDPDPKRLQAERPEQPTTGITGGSAGGKLAHANEAGLQGGKCGGGIDEAGRENTAGQHTEYCGASGGVEYTSNEGLSQSDETRQQAGQAETGAGVDGGFERPSPWGDAEYVECSDGKTRPVKPGVRLLVDGFPGRVDEIKALGNAQVPVQAAVAFSELFSRVEAKQHEAIK